MSSGSTEKGDLASGCVAAEPAAKRQRVPARVRRMLCALRSLSFFYIVRCANCVQVLRWAWEEMRVWSQGQRSGAGAWLLVHQLCMYKGAVHEGCLFVRTALGKRVQSQADHS